MSRFATKSILAAGISVASIFGSSVAANAADVIPEPPVIHVPEPMHKDIGFYIRGDISGGFSGIGEVEYTGGHKYKMRHATETAAFGVGIGARLHKYLRGDITAQYRFGGKWSGHKFTNGSACTDTNAFATCYAKAEQKFKSQEFMANAYVDIGEFGHFKPYVGGGVGVARLKFDDYDLTRTTTVWNTCGGCTPNTVGVHPSNATFTGAKTWNFAWNLQAGTTITVDKNWDLDLGYKYTHINNVKLTDHSGVEHKTNSMNFHDARVGVRYNF